MMKKIVSGILLLALPFTGLAQEKFNTPDEAATAFAAALANHNETQMTALLGENWRQYLPAEGADTEAIARFNRDWQVSHRIIQEQNIAHLNVGQAEWRLPVPIVKEADGWRFDMPAAREEILTRNIGRNELSAIEAMHAYVDAQADYRHLKGAFASKLISSEGQQDGLYWPIPPGETPSPLGPAFSPREPNAGYHGYHFRIIKSDAENGFALLAWPVEYGETGVMSFMVSQDDRVNQTDLGQETEREAAKISQFSQSAPWQAVAE